MSNFSCPNAGPTSWHVCGGGSRFVGCCLQDPCAFGCLAGNLYPASVNSDIAGKIPDLQCEEGAQFYQCTKSSFWGCCRTDACASGCPSTDLRPATLINDPAATTAYSPTGAASSSAASNPNLGSSSSTAATIGGAVGGSFGAILIGILVFCIFRKRRKSKQKRTAEATDTGENSEYIVSGPMELSSSKSVRAKVPELPDTPPPQFSAFGTDGSVYELEDNPTNPRALSELMSKDLNCPAEMEGSTASSPRNSRRFSGNSISTNITRQSVDKSLSTSPQSKSFTEGVESNRPSSSSSTPSPPLIPGSFPPRVPGSPPLAYPPTIPEDENSEEEKDR